MFADCRCWRCVRRFSKSSPGSSLHRGQLLGGSLSRWVLSVTGYNATRLVYSMADAAERLLAKLATLNDSLDDLEERLEPLLAQTLPESLLPLETIQQVKLNVALPYLVYDLIFSTSVIPITFFKCQLIL